MRFVISLFFFCTLSVLANSTSYAQQLDLVGRVFDLTLAQDTANWVGSEITFTSQESNGEIGGFFVWETVNGSSFAIETFSGVLQNDLSFTLAGIELQPHPTLGGPQGVGLADYAAQFSLDGREITNGTWQGRGGSPSGIWSATIRVPEPSIVGDFDGDEDVDCDDLDGYVGNLGAIVTAELAPLDIDGDGTITAGDADTLITTLVQTSNGRVGTFPGDLNCDGEVDVLGDAFALIGNLGNSATSYSQGDIDFDGTVDVLGDAFILIRNLGNTNEP